MKPRALILRTSGANCDGEAAYAFELAGAKTELVHLNRLRESLTFLDDFQILAIPGGFSYGDDISAGKILARQLMLHLSDPIRRFVEAGKPVIGICNGFQVLVKTGLLPGVIDGRSGQLCTLTNNEGGRFSDRWVMVAGRSKKCIWTAGIESLEVPIAHGEGRFVPADEKIRLRLWERDQVAVVYTGENPNGSVDAIAGICDETGLIFGLMPHPERHISRLQHPAWTSGTERGSVDATGPGLRIFSNAVSHVSTGVGTGV